MVFCFMKNKKNRDEQIIIKILGYCNDIESTHNHFKDDKNLFLDEKLGYLYRAGITMFILQIGELAKHLSEDFVKQHSNIQWKDIMRTRDFFAHHYIEIDYSVVWYTSHEDISELKNYLSKIMQ